MALTYIKSYHRTRTGEGVEVALCPSCLAYSHWAGSVSHRPDRDGYGLEVRPWRGEDRECSYCPTRHSAGAGASLAVVALLCLSMAGAACSSSPTAPSGPDAAITTDARYDAAFFASFAAGVAYRPASLVVYVADVDDKGNAVPALTVAQAVEAARKLQSDLGLPVDVRPMAGVPAGELLRSLTVRWWWTEPGPGQGGMGLGSTAYVAYRAATYDVCGGLMSSVVQHELMHAIGFGHTDNSKELMYPQTAYCEVKMSDRELFHAKTALALPRKN